jgi:hypothetical protein
MSEPDRDREPCTLAEAMWAWHDRWMVRADRMLTHFREHPEAKACRTRWVDYERRAGEVAAVLRASGHEQPLESVEAEAAIRSRWRASASAYIGGRT